MLIPQILLNSLVTGTQVLLLAAGLHLIHTVAKVYHIALGAIATLSAYTFYILHPLGWGEGITALLTLAMAGAAGLLSYYLLRKFINASQDLLALLSSLTLSVAIEAVLGIAFGPEGRFLIREVLPVYNFGGLHLTQVGLLTILVGLAMTLLAYIFLHVLPWGRLLRAVSQHQTCAAIMGINQHKVKIAVFTGVGVLVGAVGILSGLNNAVTPGAGLYPVITAFIALLVGGLNDFRGTVLAAYLLVLIPEMVVALGGGIINISVSWKMVLVFVLAFVLLLIRPNGLFSTLNRHN